MLRLCLVASSSTTSRSIRHARGVTSPPRSPSPPSPSPGSGLLDPVAVAALVGLVVNDHVLKAASAGTAFTVVTGKLSDVFGLVFFPVLVVAGTEIAASAVQRFRGPSQRTAQIVAAAVAVTFIGMKCSDVVGDVYASTLGALQWPFRALFAAMRGAALPTVRAVAHVVDPTDIVAVPGVLWCVRQARVRAASWANNGATNASNSAR
jgi:hypothetical protein